ncbi:hypothetical protein [Candidatus Methylacidithermus pantelleriae]|uniref:Uncharacterized protein n=1 Tax=Candidatus Methylacidithermus pantelleriae TaxID=2744239 RepID=A0A8J2FRS0_9BACT|nr:hypothetical protein [Candidatus Methylacidithermus pantelleriae]CAF0693531.1 hypothetical protein MPNT_140033 [Candidatus Methylacidithermus pantelleriae]
MGETIRGIRGLARYLKIEQRWAWRLYALGYFRAFDPGTGELYFRVEDVDEGLRRLREELHTPQERALRTLFPPVAPERTKGPGKRRARPAG